MYKYLLNLGTLQINISGPETSVTLDGHAEPLPGVAERWPLQPQELVKAVQAERKHLGIDSASLLGSI